jgi:ClpP class serine protease
MRRVKPNVGSNLACDESYYAEYKATIDKLMATHDFMDKLQASDHEEEDMNLDPFELFERGRLEVHGNTAVLRIEGFLSNQASFMETFFDEGTSYESTIWALDHIEADENITSMLLLIDSGGGEVAGLSTVTDKLSGLSRSLPNQSFGFTDSLAASAAYAMLIANSATLADEWATVGSVGVVQVITSRHRRLEEEGIDVFVARSGELKMKPSGLEPIDEATKEVVTREVNEIASLFFNLVTSLRGTISGTEWKTGRTFLASEAESLNMIDATITFSTLQERLLNS